MTKDTDTEPKWWWSPWRRAEYHRAKAEAARREAYEQAVQAMHARSAAGAHDRQKLMERLARQRAEAERATNNRRRLNDDDNALTQAVVLGPSLAKTARTHAQHPPTRLLRPPVSLLTAGPPIRPPTTAVDRRFRGRATDAALLVLACILGFHYVHVPRATYRQQLAYILLKDLRVLFWKTIVSALH